ncbi:MAG: LysM peptidoglycan-binding domain-containing protein [Armatimonadetes bacterium]|nr:LysM peptidoglycan-binding domain-containing protein [Akkermansiaceae bacterium]
MNRFFMIDPMHFAIRTSAVLFLIPLFTQCGSETAPKSVVTGPFDSRGNYVEEWADNPSAWPKPSAPATTSKPKPAIVEVITPTPTIAVVEPRPMPDDTPVIREIPSVKPKPAQVVVKPKQKPKPKAKPKPVVKKPVTVRHKVKKGDTLSSIASRYRTSVTAIKRANKISGTIIRLGQTLIIPK